MKATTFIFAFVVTLLPFAFAKEGDTCRYNGLKGTCKKTSKCTSGECSCGPWLLLMMCTTYKGVTS